MAAGVITTKFANVPKDTWDNIARRHFVIRNVWMEAYARHQQFAHVPKDTKEDIVKAVSAKQL